jgi:tetratricopeptide (TPR) repeat protein
LTALTLRIHPSNPSPSWTAHWSVNGTAFGEAIFIAGTKANAVLDVGSKFVDLFGVGRGRPMADPDDLRAMGRTLFDTWLAPAQDRFNLALEAPGPRELILRTDDPALLGAPWELIELSPDLPIGCDAGWSLRRVSLGQADVSAGPVRPGPLRLLVLTAAPIDQDQLDYEREEDLMLRASADVKGEIVTHFAETGGIDELAALVAECRPHVVHLSGHGDVDAQGRGVFAFEDDRGRTDMHTAKEIASRVFRGKEVRLAFINGCRTSQAAVSGLCRGLVAAGIPSALGWAARVVDDRATDFIAEFYRRLVRNDPTPVAAAHARDTIRRSGVIGRGEYKDQDATFALPHLYAIESSAPFDASKREAYAGPRTVHALLGDGIKGLKSGYVGRRRQVQRLLPALRQGETTFAVITCIGGSGKSTLATRAANRLQAVGYGVIPVKVSPRSSPAEAGKDVVSRLVDALGDAFLLNGREDLHGYMTLGSTDSGRRLRLAVHGLNELKLVLVLDNFEDSLELGTRRIADPDLAGFVAALAANLIQGSRAIITCRYLPEDIAIDLSNVIHLPLPEFLGHDAMKFLRRDEAVDRRIGRGELTLDLIDRIYQAVGGTPGLLNQVRTVLRKADADALLEELEGGEPGILSHEREAYCSKILTSRLYGALSAVAQAVVRRLALSVLPAPADAAAILTEMTEAEVAGPLDEGVAYGLLQRFDEPELPPLYHPPGVLRPWLTARERLAEDEAKAVHASLAAFWRSSYETDRAAELRVTIEVALESCREHARQADEWMMFRWSTVKLAALLSARSEWNQARSLLEEVPVESRDAIAWHQLATIDLNQADYAAAREKFGRLLEITQAIGDIAGVAAAWHNLATIDLNRGEYTAAREKFATAMEIKRAIGDRAGEASTLHQLATIDLNQADYAAALEKFSRAVGIRQAIGDRIGEASTLHQLATIDLERGEYAAALDKFAAAMEIRRAIGDRAGEAAIWHQLASIDLDRGDYSAAREKCATAIEIRRAIGDRAGEAATWHQLASIDLDRGDYIAAREKFSIAMEIKQAIGDRPGEAATWHQLATIDVNLGDYDAARPKFFASLQIEKSTGNRVGEVVTWHNLASIDLKQGNYAAAREKFGIAIEIRRTTGDRASEAATWHQLASIDLYERDYLAARDKYATSLQITQATGDHAGEAATWSQLGFAAFEAGRTDAAARLMSVAYLISDSVGNSDAKIIAQNFENLCGMLDINQAERERILADAMSEYQKDHGRALIVRTFAEIEISTSE